MAIRAAATRDGLYDLYLFAGTGGLDKVPDVDNAIVAGVGALVEHDVVLVEMRIMILRRWVRWWCARLCGVHWGPFPLGRASGRLGPPPGLPTLSTATLSHLF